MIRLGYMALVSTNGLMTDTDYAQSGIECDAGMPDPNTTNKRT